MRIAGVVLAAGAGRRVGGPKALLPIDGRTFVERAVALLRRPGVAEVLVVVGHEAERVARLVHPPDQVVRNPDPDAGMLGSILRALDAAESRGAGAVLLHPVDHPLVGVETIDRVVDALEAGALVAVPSHEGRRGHPAGFSRETWPALRAAPLDAGARAVLATHPEWITHVPGDAGCRSGIDTPADYERLVGPRR
jgi:nicotine blue oxidoreductase